jgi:hypothetical protein
VAPGEKPRRLGILATINADDVADRVDRHVVEAAVVAHPREKLRGDRTVRIGQVRDGELAALGVRRIAMHGELFRPIEHAIAGLGHETELFVETHLGDPMDVAQRLGALEPGRMRKAPLERREDRGLRQAGAAGTAHGENERKPEARLVIGIEPADPCELVGRALRQARAGLLVGRFARERRRAHRLPRELRVGADQRELRVVAGVAHDVDQRALECGERCERPLLACALDDPR